MFSVHNITSLSRQSYYIIVERFRFDNVAGLRVNLTIFLLDV